MRTVAKKTARRTSAAEVLSALTKSLAFQVQMIMWEDRKSGRADTPAATVGTGLRKSGLLV